MLMTMAVILALMWFICVVTGMLGGFAHILLFVAIAMIIIRLYLGCRAEH